MGTAKFTDEGGLLAGQGVSAPLRLLPTLLIKRRATRRSNWSLEKVVCDSQHLSTPLPPATASPLLATAQRCTLGASDPPSLKQPRQTFP